MEGGREKKGSKGGEVAAPGFTINSGGCYVGSLIKGGKGGVRKGEIHTHRESQGEKREGRDGEGGEEIHREGEAEREQRKEREKGETGREQSEVKGGTQRRDREEREKKGRNR